MVRAATGWMAAAVVVALMVAAPGAEACSCLFTNLQTHYNNSQEVLRVYVTNAVPKDGDIIYRARVLRDYKGCRTRGSWVKLSSANNEAAAGLR